MTRPTRSGCMTALRSRGRCRRSEAERRRSGKRKTENGPQPRPCPRGTRPIRERDGTQLGACCLRLGANGSRLDAGETGDAIETAVERDDLGTPEVPGEDGVVAVGEGKAWSRNVEVENVRKDLLP